MSALATNHTDPTTTLAADQSDNDCQLGASAPQIETINLPEDSDATSPPTKKLAALPKTTTAPTIKYAPAISPVKGTYNLYCIAIKWTDNPGPSFSSVKNCGHFAASNYHKLSNGNIIFNVIPKQIAVNSTHTSAHLNNAEKQAKKIATAGQKDPHPNIYVMFNHGDKSVSTGHGDTAHLIGTLYRDVLHEIGHCRPFVLGHSGKFDSDGKYEPLGDGSSFMSSLSSSDLTAPQLYYLGWLNQNKVAQYDIGSPAIEFNIESLDSSKTTDNLKAVLIPQGNDKKTLFLSMPTIQDKPVFALHLANHEDNGKQQSGGGSERVIVFGNSTTYNNITFEKESVSDGYTTIRISSPTP